MLAAADTFDRLTANFRWQVPERFNIAASCCDVWAAAEPERPAVIDQRSDGSIDVLTYGDMRIAANRLAHALTTRGLKPGDRIAVMLPQGRFVPIAHMAVYKLGCIAVPLANLFGVDAIGYRLKDSGRAAAHMASSPSTAMLRGSTPYAPLLCPSSQRPIRGQMIRA
jgi:acetyl-CoA synthetase